MNADEIRSPLVADIGQSMAVSIAGDLAGGEPDGGGVPPLAPTAIVNSNDPIIFNNVQVVNTV